MNLGEPIYTTKVAFSAVSVEFKEKERNDG